MNQNNKNGKSYPPQPKTPPQPVKPQKTRNEGPTEKIDKTNKETFLSQIKKPAVIATLVGALLLGGIFGAASQSGTITDLESQVATAEKQISNYQSKEDSVEKRELELKSDEAKLNIRETELKNQYDLKFAELEAEEKLLKEWEDEIRETIKSIEAKQFSNGIFVVGVDIKAGKYRTKAPSGCYYAWMSSTSSNARIINNQFSANPATFTVTLKKGQIFESSRCGTWTKIG